MPRASTTATTTTPPTPIYIDAVPIDSIALHPLNPRRDVGDVTELAESLKAVGLLEPIITAPWPTDITGRIRKPAKTDRVLLAGHRRLAAARLAGLTGLPAIHRGITTSAAQVEAMLIENLQRADLTAIEEADAYQALLDLDIPEQAIATAVGVTKRRVTDRLKLGRLPDAAKAKVHAHQTTITDALTVLEFEGDPKVTKELTAKLGTDRFNWTLETARRQAKEAREHQAHIDAVSKAGIKVVKKTPAGAKRLATVDWAGKNEVGLFPRNLHSGNERVAWVLKHHAKCPGALAVEEVPAYSGGQKKLTHWCTQPKLHPKPPVVRSDAEIAAARKEKAEKEKLRASIDVAATLRHKHLREHLPAVPAPAAAELIRRLLLKREYYSDHSKSYRLIFTALGLAMPEPTPPKRTIHHEDITRVLEPALAKLHLPQLAALLWLHQNRAGDDAYSSLNPSGWDADRARDYLAGLVDLLDYPASDFETARFAQDDDEEEASA